MGVKKKKILDIIVKYAREKNIYEEGKCYKTKTSRITGYKYKQNKLMENGISW